jgi:H+-transporting ATPase
MLLLQAMATQAKLPPSGLTSDQARARLAETGPNALADSALRPWRSALAKFWAPVPWMLEAAVIIQIALGEYAEASVIAGLLVFNAALGFFQEGRAQATLAALKSRLALSASVQRDGAWKEVPAVELVPGDLVKLSLGAVVAADVTLVEGGVLLDQSMITGESVPIEAAAGIQTYAGALVQRGEATAVVTATGPRTRFGHAAELVRTAHAVSTQQKTVVRVVRNLVLFNGGVIVLLVAFAWARALPMGELVPLVLTAVLGSIPVALPATFTLAAAVGAKALGQLGVLPTRLSAVDEAATLDILCSDKTGTLTRNELGLSAIRPESGLDEAHLLGLAALASSEGGRDPVDQAIRAAAAKAPAADLPKLTAFTPFDPSTKMAQADVVDAQGAALRIVKGAFAVVIKLTDAPASALHGAEEMEAQGFRVLAVAQGPAAGLHLAGLIGLSDSPRQDAAELIKALRDLGVRTVMVTGDAPATALSIAKAVGLEGAACPPGAISGTAPPGDYGVYAGVLPEDKFRLVQAFQSQGHTVGMCGDGANDAPALRQAQMGIAVATATDVAKSAAGIVLTRPGLEGVVAAVREGRVTFQRILTYTLNSVTGKIVKVLFLAVGLILTGHAILTPMLMVIIMITGDFLGMSLTTDHVRPSPEPNEWRVGRLTAAGVFMGVAALGFCTAALLVGKYHLGLGLGGMRTLAFLVLVYGNQATTYCNRTRQRLWSIRPSFPLVLSTGADLAIASLLAWRGIAMAPLPLGVLAGTLAGAVVFAFLADLIKAPFFHRLRIQ